MPAGVCSGWGDPHYITFDGTYYSFLDNCTYVLVQQIVPVYGHFRVLINNYFCGAEDGLSCPQSIIVEYQQARVVMTRKPILGVMTNEVGISPHKTAPHGPRPVGGTASFSLSHPRLCLDYLQRSSGQARLPEGRCECVPNWHQDVCDHP